MTVYFKLTEVRKTICSALHMKQRAFGNKLVLKLGEFVVWIKKAIKLK